MSNKDYLKWVDKSCLICSKDYKTQWVRQRFCSRECWKISHLLYQREYRKIHGYSDQKGASTLYQRKWRILALEKLGNICVKCGYSDVRALHIDHVNGDGKHERTIRKSLNRGIALELVDIKRYQLLCANCNWIKKVENNE